jgi:hypothetical protein
MALTDERIETKFSSLEQEMQGILANCGWDGNELRRHPSKQDYLRLRTARYIRADNLFNEGI